MESVMMRETADGPKTPDWMGEELTAFPAFGIMKPKKIDLGGNGSDIVGLLIGGLESCAPHETAFDLVEIGNISHRYPKSDAPRPVLDGVQLTPGRRVARQADLGAKHDAAHAERRAGHGRDLDVRFGRLKQTRTPWLISTHT